MQANTTYVSSSYILRTVKGSSCYVICSLFNWEITGVKLFTTIFGVISWKNCEKLLVGLHLNFNIVHLQKFPCVNDGVTFYKQK